MPGFIKTKKDEEVWSRAKEQAEKAGHKENWAYVTAIYKKMRGSSLNRFQRMAYNMLIGKSSSQDISRIYAEFGIDVHSVPSDLQSQINEMCREILKLRKK